MTRKSVTAKRRRLTIESMESRRLMSADLPTGATPIDTAEFLLGSVAVTPVFFESDGTIDPSTEDWDSDEIDEVLAKIRESVDWWTDLLATKTSTHSLSFTIDDTYARNPVATGYEPINRSSQTNELYVGNWLTDLGYGEAGSIDRAIRLFNNDQRELHGTDWAFTIVVVDSSNDVNDFFEPGDFSGAFAYPGGMYYVVPSERPVWTYAHELGHIFWARDEYPGGSTWTDRRGYYNAYTFNASDTPNPPQQVSIMRGISVAEDAYKELVSPETTLALLGWQDSDGDGVFDVLDVPLQLDVVGLFDATESEIQLIGNAHVDFLPNANSSGNQSDITLAKVSELQYRFDDGDWRTLLSPDAASFEFNVTIPVTETFTTYEVRVIDTSTDVTSENYLGTRETPLFSGLGGVYAYLDEDASGSRAEGESLLAGTQFSLETPTGPLPTEVVSAPDLPFGPITTVNGLTFSTLGERADGGVDVLTATNSVWGKVFQTFDPFRSRSSDRWNVDRKLVVSSEQATGHVDVNVISQGSTSPGLEAGAYVKIESYDENDVLLDRFTSEPLPEGEMTLSINDAEGRIRKVIVYGHAGTEILVSGISFGQSQYDSTSQNGTIVVENLPNGNYVVTPVTPNLIYQLPSEVEIEVVDGSVNPVGIAAVRVDSPRHNVGQPEDVDESQSVSPFDALLIINDLGRNGSRTFSAAEADGTLLDVNNDGMVTPIDALRVINYLGRGEGEGEGEGEGLGPFTGRLQGGSTGEGEGTGSFNSDSIDYFFGLRSGTDRSDDNSLFSVRRGDGAMNDRFSGSADKIG
ncbi:MAG: dockerin type I domain-containing protein, partial [Planctomycetota bacterium]